MSASCQAPGGSPFPEAKALAVVLQEEFDTPFRFYDAATGDLVVVSGQAERMMAAPPGEHAAALELAAEDRPKVIVLPDGRYLLGFPSGRWVHRAWSLSAS
jgi:hypothetical protein